MTISRSRLVRRAIVINGEYGDFGLSYRATMAYAARKGIKLYPYADEISA
jgi:hypothetical protein